MTAMDEASRQPLVDREEMARLLKASIRKRRPRYYPTLGVILAVFAVALVLVAWLLWPRPSLPPLNLLACDQIARPGESVAMEAWITPKDPHFAVPDLGGLNVSFEPLLPPARPGAALADVKTRSAANGHVRASITAPSGAEAIEFKVAHGSPEAGQRTEDRARLFVCRPETRLLLVELAAVADAAPHAWQGSGLGDIPARQAAGEALQKARSKNYQIVYIAAGAPTPMAYRLMRAWVETKTQEPSPFPDGPILGRLPQSGAPAARDWIEDSKDLKRRWPGSFAAVAKDPRLAEVLRDAGATTFVLTEAGETPAETRHIRTWAELKL
jgi:hypothetical protein